MTGPDLRREPATLIEMTIKGLMVDPITNMPIVILRDKDGQRVLPIWVGVFEANAIALQIENVTPQRPMTHDLLNNVIHDLKADIEKIVVSDTIPLRPGAPDNIKVLSTAGTFADSIRRIFTDDSVSEIFAGENQLF